MCSALVDRLEHGGEDLVAVAQHVDAVALGGGHADDALRGAPDRVRRPRPLAGGTGRVHQGGDASAPAGAGRVTSGSRSGSASGSDCSTFSSSCGSRRPERTASSCAATAPPNSTAIAESSTTARGRRCRRAARRCQPKEWLTPEEQAQHDGDHEPQQHRDRRPERQPAPRRLMPARAPAEQQRDGHREQDGERERPAQDRPGQVDVVVVRSNRRPPSRTPRRRAPGR